MARLICSYDSEWDKQKIFIEIHDRKGITGDHIFCTSSQGAIISLEGRSRDIYQAIQPSSCEVDILVENEHHHAFINDLALGEENRFWIRVYAFYPNWNIQDNLFIGNVIVDEVTYQDTSQDKFWLTITATDGLADLKNYEFKVLPNIPYTRRDKVTEFLKLLFSYLPTFDLYNNPRQWSPDFPAINQVNDHEMHIDVFADGMDERVSPFEQAYLDGEIFFDREEDTNVFMSCYEVLERILTTFDLRLYTRGRLIFESWNSLSEYSEGNVFRHSFYYADLSFSSGQWRRSTDTVENHCRRVYEGGTITMLSPLRQVKINYHHTKGTNYLFDHRWMFDLGSGLQCFPIPRLPRLGDKPLRFRFLVNIHSFILQNRQRFTENSRLVFFFTIQFGDNYYVRESAPYMAKSETDNGYWTKDAGTYMVGSVGRIPIDPREAPIQELKYTDDIEIISTEIPADASGEEARVCLEVRMYNVFGNEMNFSQYPFVVQGDRINLSFINEEDVLAESVTRSLTVVNNVENTFDYERDIYMGDGPSDASPHRITLDQRGEELTQSWSSEKIPSAPLYEWLAHSLAARRSAVTRFKEGQIEMGYAFQKVISYEGMRLAPVIGRYHTRSQIMQGEWADIRTSLGTSSEVIQEDIQKLRPVTGSSLPNTYHADQISTIQRGPLSVIIPDTDLSDIIDLPVEEQRKIVHQYKNGVRMMLTYDSEGPQKSINEFRLEEQNGVVVIRPAVGWSASDTGETIIHL